MEQKRFLLAILLSSAILFGYQMLYPKKPSTPVTQDVAALADGAPGGKAMRPVEDPSFPGNRPEPGPVPQNVPRLKIDAPRLSGSMSLQGARLDNLVTRDYHETVDPKSPLWPLLIPRGDREPTWVQFGWSADRDDVHLPSNDTIWTASAPQLSVGQPVTLSWDNGQGLVFGLQLSIDDNYMFDVQQSVRNTGGQSVALRPWARVRRDYTPQTAGTYILHEGPIGVMAGRLQEMTYAKTKSGGQGHGGVAWSATDKGGWAGMTDKYMLTAVVPDQTAQVTASFRHVVEAGADRYQVDMIDDAAQTLAPGQTSTRLMRVFSGAKEVHLLDRYEHQDGIPSFDKAVDFGWFYFLTKPMFYALDWLNGRLGNFGLAIMVFTVFVKTLFFPLANKSYRSMSKMRLLGPKMTALREQHKDDPAKMQQALIGLYKAEGVNPASGCMPMLVQIPVFFSLYKVIYVTIEMWHAPFFGWIKDLSVADPTNVFNLFGLIPFDPTAYFPILHLGIWPLIMGVTMFLQQRLNPAPPDPVQARMFQFMPVIFTFMLGRFPAGLVIYWSWNNLLTIAQQWLIMRTTRLKKPLASKS